MEENLKKYKSGNYIIIILLVILLSMLLYCAQGVGKEQFAYVSTIIIIASLITVSINFRRKEKFNRDSEFNKYIEIESVIDDVDEDEETPEYIIEEEEYRSNIIYNSLQSSFSIIDNDDIGSKIGIILKEEEGLKGIVYIENSNNENNFILNEGMNINIKLYNSSRIDMVKIKNIYTNYSGDIILVLDLTSNYYNNFLTLGKDVDIKIGTKCYIFREDYINSTISVEEVNICQIINNKNLNKINRNNSIYEKYYLYNTKVNSKISNGYAINSFGEFIGVILKGIEDIDIIIPIEELVKGINLK